MMKNNASTHVFKRAEKGKWSSTDYAQKERLIQILEESIDQLKKEMVEAAE
jgi:hypothetical protein